MDELISGRIESGSHYDNIANADFMTVATQKDVATQHATDSVFNRVHNLISYRFNEEMFRREMCIVKMGATDHQLEWLPFKTTRKGIEMLKS